MTKLTTSLMVGVAAFGALSVAVPQFASDADAMVWRRYGPPMVRAGSMPLVRAGTMPHGPMVSAGTLPHGAMVKAGSYSLDRRWNKPVIPQNHGVANNIIRFRNAPLVQQRYTYSYYGLRLIKGTQPAPGVTSGGLSVQNFNPGGGQYASPNAAQPYAAQPYNPAQNDTLQSSMDAIYAQQLKNQVNSATTQSQLDDIRMKNNSLPSGPDIFVNNALSAKSGQLQADQFHCGVAASTGAYTGPGSGC